MGVAERHQTRSHLIETVARSDLLTSEEFRNLLLVLDRRERVMVLLAGSTALRPGELFGLRWEDVDFREQLIRVTHSIYPLKASQRTQ